MFLKGIILTSVAEIKENRTMSAVYYLLVGKRSIQTIQDSYLYNLDQYYGICSNLRRECFDEIILELIQDHFLIESEVGFYSLSNLGEKWVKENISKYPLHYFNGIKYNGSDKIFYYRLLLIIQVLTNRKMKQSNYIPVIDQPPIANWVIRTYQSLKHYVDESLQHIYTELLELLSHFSTLEATLFVNRLTSYKSYGMSLSQLAVRHQINEKDVQLYLNSVTHEIMTLIMNDKKKYPFLKLFLRDLSHDGFLSQSATKTQELLNKGYDITLIAKVRRLRINTIYDHLVEITLADDNFSIDPYVTVEEQREILTAYKQTKSSKLKTLKNSVNENISYFQIRLVLAALQSKEMGDPE